MRTRRMQAALGFVALTLTGCAGVGPTGEEVAAFLTDHGLSRTSPVAIVDLDGTIHDGATDLPMPDSAQVLRTLADDHVIVYLTARPTYFKLPGLTHNRADTEEFIRAHRFPAGLVFTSSLWEWVWCGEGDGKLLGLARLAAQGLDDAALAFGDKAHDLRAYRSGESVAVRTPVILFVNDASRVDPDVARMPADAELAELPGDGSAWSQIGAALSAGLLTAPGAWSATETRE